MFRLWMESTSAKYKQSTYIITAFADHQTQSKQICCGGGMLSKGLRVFFTPEKYPGHNDALHESAAVCLGAFCAGYAWQPMVDISKEMLYSFNTTMALVGFVCSTLFFIGYSFGIFIFIRRNVWSSFQEFVRDITLAICVMGSAGFFVGTDVGFPKNWLRDVVGERDGEDAFFDCLKSGFSTFLGLWLLVQY